MGLFDKPEYKSLDEDFPEGTPMVIHWATYDGEQQTSFGYSPQATIGVTDAAGIEEDATSYRVFGNLATQISQMDEDELPANVKVGKAGRAKIWEPATPRLTSIGD